MSKPTVQLPPPYLTKMRAVVHAGITGAVLRAFPEIGKSTWHAVSKNGYVSYDVLERLNLFFTDYGDERERLKALDFDFVSVEQKKLVGLSHPPESAALLPGASNLTGDLSADIRTLYLERRHEEALALARAGLHSPDAENRIASAQSLIYVNQRLGRTSAMVAAVVPLRRLAQQHPKLFSTLERIRTAADITKCLSEHGHPHLAAPFFDRIEELCRSRAISLPPHVKASLMRGVSQCRYFLQLPQLAHRSVKFAIELSQGADATQDDFLSHTNALVFYSVLSECSAKSFDRELATRSTELERMDRFLRDASQSGEPDEALLPGVSLATMLVMLTTSVYSSPGLSHQARRDLIDQRAHYLFRAGLADHKVLPYSFAGQLLNDIDLKRPAGRIFGSLIKDRLPTQHARELESLARQLLADTV